jgi:hypothetical protein
VVDGAESDECVVLGLNDVLVLAFTVANLLLSLATGVAAIAFPARRLTPDLLVASDTIAPGLQWIVGLA